MEWPPELGNCVSVKLGELGWIEAKVAWKLLPRFGLEFLAPIDPAEARRPVGGETKPFVPDRPDNRRQLL
ncbi:MAG: hypothetical protein ABIP24_00770 [Croceibacterium sp.]